MNKMSTTQCRSGAARLYPSASFAINRDKFDVGRWALTVAMFLLLSALWGTISVVAITTAMA